MSNTEEIRDQILATIEQRQQQLLSLSHGISSHPELAFEEYWASSAVAELLENAGFVVQRAAYGLPTALEAVYGQGEFTVAVVGEYDALPEIGHGCGHNIIATAGVGAALALKPVADRLGLRIKFLGTPAEEIGGGKILMLQQGAWDDVDFSLMVHGNTGAQYRCFSQGTQAYELLDVTYTGRTAHAAAAPHEGINAGSAVTLAQVAFGLLRQQLKSSVVVSSFVVSGGTATNVIPGEAKLQVEIRATQSSDWEDARQRVRACLEGAAIATGCQLSVVQPELPYEPMRQDPALAQYWDQNLERLGYQISGEQPPTGGSTDMGNISQYLPAIHPMLAVRNSDAVMHTSDFARDAASTDGDEAALNGARALALTVADVANDPELVQRLRAAREQRPSAKLSNRSGNAVPAQVGSPA